MQSEVMTAIKQIKLRPKDIRQSRGGRAVPWENIVKHYKLCIGHWRCEPMLHLIESLAASTVANELFPTTSMHTLLITDNEQFYHDDNMLFISYDPEKQKFQFEHRTLSGKNDKRICDEAEVFQTLSLFLKYKFGVLFSPISPKR
jgi:hypothetical protein